MQMGLEGVALQIVGDLFLGGSFSLGSSFWCILIKENRLPLHLAGNGILLPKCLGKYTKIGLQYMQMLIDRQIHRQTSTMIIIILSVLP